MDENAVAGKKGGGVARRARKDYELKTGKKAVSGNNFLPSGAAKRISITDIKKDTRK